MAITIEPVAYGGWANCIRLSNGAIELVATLDVGPRIIRFGMVGGANEMYENTATLGHTGGDDWNIFGGHRLWHSPEDDRRSYIADNSAVACEKIPNGVRLIQKEEPWAHIQKQIDVTMSPDTNEVFLTHRMTNAGAWPIELALWALTVMAPGGLEVAPQNRRNTGLLSNRTLGLWPYTDMSDERVTWLHNFICLRQIPGSPTNFKFGLPNEDGWAAYFNHGNLFIKRFKHIDGATYPDGGMSFETFTNEAMLEIESLSPLVRLAPGQTAEHSESWQLHAGVAMPETTEDAVTGALSAHIAGL